MADLTFDCPACGHSLIVDAQAVGLVVACPECGTQLLVPNPDENAENGETNGPETVGGERPAIPSTRVAAPEMAANGPALEYKVVSMPEGEGAAGKLTADAVEYRLNELMQDGWLLRSAVTVHSRDAQDKPRQELLLVMERRI